MGCSWAPLVAVLITSFRGFSPPRPTLSQEHEKLLRPARSTRIPTSFRPAATLLPPGQGRREPHLYGRPEAGVASRDTLSTTASRPAELQGFGHKEATLSSCWRREEYSMVFSSVPAPPPVKKPEEHHRELWSRVAGPSWWAWREVDGRLGGGADGRFLQTRRSETIEREG